MSSKKEPWSKFKKILLTITVISTLTIVYNFFGPNGFIFGEKGMFDFDYHRQIIESPAGSRYGNEWAFEKPYLCPILKDTSNPENPYTHCSFNKWFGLHFILFSWTSGSFILFLIAVVAGISFFDLKNQPLKTKILIICPWGRNRSRHLASYLEQKGYETKFGGVLPEGENLVTQDMVDWSQVIIFVTPETQESFIKLFFISHQKVITLNVEDRLKILAPNKPNPTAEEWTQIQEEKVYPELERQIDKYLPFEK